VIRSVPEFCPLCEIDKNIGLLLALSLAIFLLRFPLSIGEAGCFAKDLRLARAMPHTSQTTGAAPLFMTEPLFLMFFEADHDGEAA
jgi:hypothetical protein